MCPTRIITNARADPKLLEVVKSQIHDTAAVTTSQMDNQSDERVHLSPTPEFAFEYGKSKLLGIQLATLNDPLRAQQSRQAVSVRREALDIFIQGIVQLNNREMVGSAGALLAYISKSNLDKQSANFSLRVESIESICLQNTLQVSASAMISLRIFHNQEHPNVHRLSHKEGLSLFGILSREMSSDGAQLLRQWLLRPLKDREAINERLDAVAWFVRPEFQAARVTIQASLKRIKRIPILQTVDVDTLQKISQHINDVVDFDACKLHGRLVAKPDVDEELDRLKSLYGNLDEILSDIAVKVSHTLPSDKQMNLVYFPQLGYLIALPICPSDTSQSNTRGTSNAETLDRDSSNLVFQFSTEKTEYYKNDRMYALDEELGDIHSNIVDRELEIMQQLREAVLAHSDMLVHTVRVLNELEWYVQYDVRVVILYYLQKPILHISKGRHPLLELCVDQYIANHTHLGCHSTVIDQTSNHSGLHDCNIWHGNTADSNLDPYPKMMLLTGANFSGKSAYLHQVALITFMAHIGSFVPAESATIGLTDRILTRIQSDDSVSAMKSTFLTDLQQLSAALCNSTEHSLIIIDEFGKGTAISDGIGLFCAVLESLAERQATCPRILAATHFHEALEPHVFTAPPNTVSLFSMKIVQCDNRNTDEVVSFLYEVEHGKSTVSLGVHCARLAGISEHITSRGKVFYAFHSPIPCFLPVAFPSISWQ
eukprot:jgi/Hompol1/6628/HPOL_002899-RA